MTYPSGGNYPETKEDYADHFERLANVASPEQLNNFHQEMTKKGGKFAVLSRLMQGEIDIETADKLMKISNPGETIEVYSK